MKNRPSFHQLFWAIELLADYADWRALFDTGPDDQSERQRWLKMCHRLGSTQAKDIVALRREDRT